MITTFYPAGGVGESSSVLAAVAVQLARWRYRTLCVDWDVTGSGLTGWFAARLAAAPDWGTVDLVRDVGDSRDLDRYAVRVLLSEEDGQLDLVPARGRRSAGDLGPADWIRLHRDRYLGSYLESCAEQWRARYDAVLIHAPTGTGPGSAVAAAHLPDALVLLVSPGGSAAAAELVGRIDRARDRLPYDRGRLLVLPCPVGPEPGDCLEPVSARSAALDAVFADWAARDVPVDRLRQALAGAGSGVDGPIRTLAALLARELRETELLRTVASTEDYVARAGAAPNRGDDPGPGPALHRAAARTLDRVLLGILPAEEWVAIERSVLAMSAALDRDDLEAVGRAAADVAALAVRSGAPRSAPSAVPPELRGLVEGVLRALRPPSPPD